ncbi:apolipoprotein N-acyltransferase [Neisseriaceae bacterium ESL0693]|nr:apolipoprotein N-acyltransferase [Neisseriaceae bacterium ESL0693]
MTILTKPYVFWPVIMTSAILTPFTFAPYQQFWLMPLLLALLAICLSERVRFMGRGAYVWALIAYTAQFYWIDIALHDVAGLPQIYALPLTLLLPAYLAIYPALVFWLLGKFRFSWPIKWVFIWPLLWAIGEFVRERVFTGFGWGAVGYSQMAHMPLAGYAPVGGILLVNWATIFSAGCLAWFWFAPTWKKRLIPLLFLLVVSGIGSILWHINFTHPDGTKATVALPQGNIAQSIKWDEASLQPTLQRYFDQVAQSHADIIILPETAIPVMRQDIPDFILAQFSQQAIQNGAALAMGIPQYTQDGTGYQNAVINLSLSWANQHDSAFYAKNHLVPFGEYIPLPKITGWIYQTMDMPLTGFSGGGRGQTPLSLANQQVAFNICYEDGFGDELIASAKKSSLLANVSNMAWYGHSHAMYQQLQQSQARALELGRYMVRATNNGVTAIINPKGQVIATLAPDTTAILQGTVQGYHGSTPYMWLGSSWPIAIFMVILLILSCIYGYRYSKIRQV